MKKPKPTHKPAPAAQKNCCEDDNQITQLTHAVISATKAVNHLTEAISKSGSFSDEDKKILEGLLASTEARTKRLEALDGQTPPM